MRKIVLVVVGVLSMSSVSAGGSVVKIEGSEGSWRLVRNGKPFFIQGGGGNGSKALLKEIGGNSFRTWGADQAKADLDLAQKNGLTLMLGFWLGHHEHYFDYKKTSDVEEQTRNVLKTVREIKDHPALLGYTLGNEMELNMPESDQVIMWTYINDLAKKVREIDPNHPIGTVVADIQQKKADYIMKYLDAVDFIGFNSYGGSTSIGQRWRACGGRKPYIVTEYGPLGAWECGKNAQGMPLEWNSTRKADWYREAQEKTILADKDKWCLGSYAFAWGEKNEASPTWFGTMLPDGTRLEVVATLAKLWGGKIGNRCPRVEDMVVSSDAPAEGEIITASVKAKDPEGDRLSWHWALVKEAAHYGVVGESLPVPQGWDEAILEGQGTSSVKVKLPGGGKFRLYAYCFDGKGNAAYANVPMTGTGPRAKFVPRPVKLPFYVYDDAPRHWIVSGYMGNTSALRGDVACKENPHSGDNCMRFSYSANDNWAGVMWQDPANDWGKQEGGVNLSKANTLVFWARGAEGGEKVKFYCGGLKNCEFPDSGGNGMDFTLTKEWRRYRIALDGEDLSVMKTGFAFTLVGPAKTFYLDDIHYIEQ